MNYYIDAHKGHFVQHLVENLHSSLWMSKTGGLLLRSNIDFVGDRKEKKNLALITIVGRPDNLMSSPI